MDAPPRLSIRSARVADAEAIVELQSLPGFRFGTLRMPHPRLEAVRKWLETLTDTNHALLAFDGETLVGTAGLQAYAGRRSHVGSIGMGVHDDWVGRGVGSRLLRELTDIAENWLGLQRIELTVYTDNAAAIALYRKFGFAVEGRHRAYALRDGAYVDAYAMARLHR